MVRVVVEDWQKKSGWREISLLWPQLFDLNAIRYLLRFALLHPQPTLFNTYFDTAGCKVSNWSNWDQE